MTRFAVAVFLWVLALLSTMGPAGCGGTETGNPADPWDARGGNPAIVLAEAICEKLVDCFEEEAPTQEACGEAIRGSETLGAAFGIQQEDPPLSYEQIIEKFENGELKADEQAVEACAAAIRDLECDPAVLAVDVEGGLGNVDEMIPEKPCSKVFSGS